MSEEELQTKIEQLLRGTDLAPAEIAKQLKIPVRKVYRNKAWPEVKQARANKSKSKQPETPTPETPTIEFEGVETPPTEAPPLLGVEKEVEKEEKAPEPQITVEGARIINLEHGAFKGLLDAGFSILCETTNLTAPNPVKIEKLDHALVDFCIAWKIDFGDPRVLPTIILAASIGEIALPMAREIRKKRQKPKVEEPKTVAEKIMSAETPPRTDVGASKVAEERGKELLG
jgi:hypothetical protein